MTLVPAARFGSSGVQQDVGRLQYKVVSSGAADKPVVEVDYQVGLGRIVALCDRSSTSFQIR